MAVQRTGTVPVVSAHFRLLDVCRLVVRVSCVCGCSGEASARGSDVCDGRPSSRRLCGAHRHRANQAAVLRVPQRRLQRGAARTAAAAAERQLAASARTRRRRTPGTVVVQTSCNETQCRRQGGSFPPSPNGRASKNYVICVCVL